MFVQIKLFISALNKVNTSSQVLKFAINQHFSNYLLTREKIIKKTFAMFRIRLFFFHNFSMDNG